MLGELSLIIVHLPSFLSGGYNNHVSRFGILHYFIHHTQQYRSLHLLTDDVDEEMLLWEMFGTEEER